MITADELHIDKKDHEKELLCMMQKLNNISQLLLELRDNVETELKKINDQRDKDIKEREQKEKEQKEKELMDKKLKELKDIELKELKDKQKSFHKILIDKFGEIFVKQSLVNGRCVVCGEWDKHHQYFKDYNIGTCCPPDNLIYRKPNTDPNEDDNDCVMNAEDYQELVDSLCVNQVRQLLGLENIDTCHPNNGNCIENWSRYG